MSILGVRMMVKTGKDVGVIDEEWYALILEAKELGLSIDEIREFLNQNEVKELVVKNI